MTPGRPSRLPSQFDKYQSMISIIVAKARNNAIGRDNQMLWHISGDLKYFKKVTLGHPVIMGYNTWLSIGAKPLPGRKNIVVSRRHSALHECGAEFCSTLEEALAAARTSGTGSEEIFVIGGGQLYARAMSLADRLYITEVDTSVDDAQVYFPEIEPAIWSEETRSALLHDDRSGYDYAFVTYARKVL